MPTDERRAQRLRVLAETGQAFADAAVDIARLLDLVVKTCADHVGDSCSIRLVAEDGVSLVPVATHHSDPEVERYIRDTSDRVPMRVGESATGRVVATGDPLLIPTIELSQVSTQVNPALMPMLEKVGLSSVIVVCLRAREKRLGFIGLSRMGRGRPAYTEDDLALAQDLADRAALAIENARLVDELELRVAARTAQLEAANAELESFCYSVSHDLRAPLRAIDGFSQILQAEHTEHLDDEAKRIVSVIRKNSTRMGQLIDDLLRFSRLGRAALRFTDVAMGPVVQAVWQEVRSAEPSRDVTLTIGELATVACDRDLVRQVWVNLLGNALKYTRHRSDARIAVACTVDANEARFEVVDNGDGYDPRHADKLFKVFQRLHGHTEFEGTGVGLALVARIVGRHGGRVWAEGRPKQGATFGFSLPKGRVQ